MSKKATPPSKKATKPAEEGTGIGRKAAAKPQPSLAARLFKDADVAQPVSETPPWEDEIPQVVEPAELNVLESATAINRTPNKKSKMGRPPAAGYIDPDDLFAAAAPMSSVGQVDMSQYLKKS